MAAQIGRVERHDDLVPGSGPDLVVAARAAVRLHRLVRLDVPDLDLVELPLGPERVHQRGSSAQTSSPTITTSAAATTTTSLPRETRLRNGL